MTHLLIIEDEEEIRESLVFVLQSEGFLATGCSSGEQGIRVASSVIPDLILCDIMMPGIDGHEVLRRIRGIAATSTIPFIFMSGLTDVRGGMNEGADDYIIKPCSLPVLITAIKTRLMRHQLDENHAQALAKIAGKEARTDILRKLPDSLNNPLNKLIGSLQLLKDKLYPNLSQSEF